MKKEHILIVEDDGILAVHLQNMLVDLDYGVMEPVATGEDAIAAVAGRRPDLVLMDIHLVGEIDGITAAERIRSAVDVPIVFLTGYSHEPLIQRAKTTAPYGYLLKPVSSRELSVSIEMAIYRHTLDQQLKEHQAALQLAHDELECRVRERTADLLSANESLRLEMEERKQAEERIVNSKATLNMVLDGISDPVIMMDAAYHIMSLNKAAKEYYELASYKEAFGKPCFEAFRKRSIPCEGCKSPFSAMNGYSGVYERKGTGSDKVEMVIVDVVKDESGVPKASIIRISDITQAKKMEKQLLQNTKLASLGLLISGIAHEINNPNTLVFFNIPILRDYLRELTGIVEKLSENHSNIELCGMPYPEFRIDIFKLLDDMEHGSKRINSAVSALKNFSRTREGVENRLVPLNEVIEKALTICRAEVRKRGTSLKVSIPDDLPPVFIDPDAVEQVLVNLLINAAHALDKEDSIIKISVLPSYSHGQLERCVIEVCDNGSGMDEKVRSKIFDPFFTTKTSAMGTGLGLYICQNLIEKIGGSIEVDSQPGEGSIFRIVLPTNS